MSHLIRGSGPWATLDTGVVGRRDAVAMSDVALREGFALLVDDSGVIQDSGPSELLGSRHAGLPVIDLGPRLVTPGFVDPHTHPVFARTREDEFEMRLAGKSYVEIAQAGGGILNSVRHTRAATDEALLAGLLARADRFLRLGTTTIEAKSGYGLSTDSELRSLRAIRQASRVHPLEFVPTFLGAHEVPSEYREDRESYIRLLTEEMLPAVVSERLAEACDVFCEAHVFGIAESRRILQRAKDLGLALHVHADEIVTLGGAELAAELGALSADHLVAVSEPGIDRLREAGVCPILLPATSLFLRLPNDAPGRAMLDRGLTPALATDYNPGSSPTMSMPLVMTLACLRYSMTPAQALSAATINAAHALGRGHQIGVLAPGYQADLVAFDLPNLNALAYQFGESFVHTVVKKGRIVVKDGRRLSADADPTALAPSVGSKVEL